MKYYVKAKRYLIKPSYRSNVCKSIKENFDSDKSARIIRYIVDGKPLTFARWLRYFDYDLLEEILVEEDNVENIEDLGI